MAPALVYDYEVDARTDGWEDPVVQYQTAVLIKHRPHSTTKDTLPAGWPGHLDSEMAWEGAKYRDEESYTYSFTEEEKGEIGAALRHFKDLRLDGQDITRATFPLPLLEQRLNGAAEEIHSRRGFVIFRGLDPKQYSEEDNVLIYLGISSYIAEKRGIQDDQGMVFGHVREAKKMKAAQGDRLTMDSTIAADFHTDKFADVLAMQVRSLAARGGNHIIASSWHIYNQLAATRPDLVHVLAQPIWAFNTRGLLHQPHPRPLLYHHASRILLNLQPHALTDPDFAIQPLTTLQHEALSTIQSLAAANQITLNLQPGDLLYINNFSILHGREAFEDEIGKERYLVRLWLQSSRLRWDLPEQLERGNKIVFREEEEGGVARRWNVRYVPKLLFDVRDRLDP